MAYAYETSGPIGHRATLGLIVLQVDETIEHDFRRLLPVDGVALHVTRIPSAPTVGGETLARMADHLSSAAALLPPPARYDAVGYACTSGTAVIGMDRVAQAVTQGCRTRSVTQPVSALIAACRHLGLRRLALLSPYVADVSDRLRAVLHHAGVETPVFGSFDEAREEKVARIDGPSVHAAALDLAARGDVDGVFLSCTNLRTLDVIDPIERDTGLPVLSSNQVLAWHMAHSAGVTLPNGPGQLLRP